MVRYRKTAAVLIPWQRFYLAFMTLLYRIPDPDPDPGVGLLESADLTLLISCVVASGEQA